MKKQEPKVTLVGELNVQRFAETLARLLAERDGMEVVPGSVRVCGKEERT